MKIMKRDGSEATFDRAKIEKAIEKANASVIEKDRLPHSTIQAIASSIEAECKKSGNIPTVESVQDKVVYELMAHHAYVLANNYIVYRYEHQLKRQKNTTDDKILSILQLKSQEAMEENANKNPTIVSTQRDYMAGEVSKDLTRRKMLPEDIVKAHDEGRIHFHDADYFSQPMHNCDLVNLEDMLQNGTVISGTMIERPHLFSTACNIATQIIAQVASSQYGGQTITLTHLAPFVNESRRRFRVQVVKEFEDAGISLDDNQINLITEERVRKDVEKGVQIIQYQVITLMTTNGQAPFISVAMYLNEAGDDQLLRDDLAMIIEEVLRQRYQGVKNEQGVYITPAFPKLLYFLEEDNAYPGTKYWNVTETAIRCSLHRMVPDYISEKIMLQNKIDKNGNGNAYPCMGCVAGDEVIAYRMNGNLYVESFSRMWARMSRQFEIQTQQGRKDDKFIDLRGVEIYDNVNGWTKCYRVIRNNKSDLLRIKFSNGRMLDCTPDHPFETENRGVVQASNLSPTDVIRVDKTCEWGVDEKDGNEKYAWLLGLVLCDAAYVSRVCLSVAAHGEEDIVQQFQQYAKEFWGLDTRPVLQERERKGTYLDVSTYGNGADKVTAVRSELASIFGGTAKIQRHIPNEVFSWSKNAKMAFLAGIIDADGYINDGSKVPWVQVGSTNKELALQEALLAQSLGMRATVYQNHYKGKGRGDTIRYHVAFHPTKELIGYMVCEKKKAKFVDTALSNASIALEDFASPLQITPLDELQPSYDVTTESEHFTVSGIYSHNCRSFLTPYIDPETGKGKYYGRFNQGVVTVNLPFVAMASEKNMDEFWREFDETLELCHRALRIRHERLLGTPSDVAPILWQYGALARLKKGEVIDKLLYGGYSTLSLGYAGLYEAVYYLTGHSHTEPEGEPLAIAIMQRMNDKCNEWKTAENIDYSLYGTPLESTTYKFAKALKQHFGVVENVSSHNYVTNSYHVCVREKINAFDKLKFESKFQKLSPGGAISYVEIPNMENNIEAAEAIVEYIYDNIMYAELNSKSDYCQCCGYSGEIQIVEDDGKLVWECPNCGNRDQHKMNVARRTCGYIGTQYWNQGRTAEIRDRVTHIDCEMGTK